MTDTATDTTTDTATDTAQAERKPDYIMGIEREKLTSLFREILMITKEKIALGEDMKDLKLEMQSHINKSLVNKAIKVYQKRFSEQEAKEYAVVCDMLGISYGCGEYQPDQSKEKNKALLVCLQRYELLAEEAGELNQQLTAQYNNVKALNISVPVVKKLIDFCIHPDKLKEFYDNNPFLESYIKLIPELS